MRGIMVKKINPPLNVIFLSLSIRALLLYPIGLY
jgi:hypothetical protein